MKGKDGKNNDHVDEQKPKSFENDSYLPMFALWQYYLFMVNLPTFGFPVNFAKFSQLLSSQILERLER